MTRSQKPVLTTLLAGAAIGLASSASAAVLYDTEFDGPSGTQPAGWTVEEGGGLALNGSGAYVKSTGGVTRSIYSGPYSDGSSSFSKADSTISADFTITGSTGSDASVIGRYTDGPAAGFGDDTFYGARFNAGGSFQIFKFNPNFGVVESATVTGYDFGEVWNISLDLSGTSLTAVLTDDTGSVVSTLSDTDSDVTGPGTFGVRPANQTVSYLNYTVEGDAIPEPASLALVGAGLMLVLGRRRG